MLALAALTLSLATPWALEAFAPPGEGASVHVTVPLGGETDSAIRLPGPETVGLWNARYWTAYWPLLVCVLGGAALALAATGYLRQEDGCIAKLAGGAAIVAMGVQFLLAATGVVFASLVVFIALKALDIL